MFSLITYSLMTSVDPTGAGEVTVETSPTAGGYVAGTEVNVAAVPGEGYRFSHWSGAGTGSKNPVTIVMDSGKQLSAHFVPAAAFKLWWIAPGIGVIIFMLPVFFLKVRRSRVTSK